MTVEGLSELQMPARIAALRRAPFGPYANLPVPFFVPWTDTGPDFLSVRPGAVEDCHFRSLCWLCGQKLGVFKAFVVGAMAGFTRVSDEPPSHRDCAEYAARVGMAQDGTVLIVWVTKDYLINEDPQGITFLMGDPEDRLFFKSGAEATPRDIAEAVKADLPAVMLAAEKRGPKAVEAVKRIAATLEATLK